MDDAHLARADVRAPRPEMTMAALRLFRPSVVSILSVDYFY